MGVDGNETADQLARQGSSHPLIGPGSAFGISAKVPREGIRDWTSSKHEHWQSTCGQRETKGFLKRPSVKRAEEILNLSRDQLRILMGLLTGHCHLNRHLFTLWLVDNPGCGRCKQAFAMASHVLCDCKALSTLRFKHLSQRMWNRVPLLKSPSEDTALCSKCGAAECGRLYKRLTTVKAYSSLWLPP
jgi:hypothetical protein